MMLLLIGLNHFEIYNKAKKKHDLFFFFSKRQRNKKIEIHIAICPLESVFNS